MQEQNLYLTTLSNPWAGALTGVPDDDQTSSHLKTIVCADSFTVPTNGGAMDVLVVFRPHSTDLRTMLYVNRNDGNGFLFWRDVEWSEQVNIDYTQFRSVSAGLHMESATVATGNFPISGFINGIQAQNIPPINTLRHAEIMQYSRDNKSMITNVKVAVGATVLALPTPVTFMRPLKTTSNMNLDKLRRQVSTYINVGSNGFVANGGTNTGEVLVWNSLADPHFEVGYFGSIRTFGDLKVRVTDATYNFNQIQVRMEVTYRTVDDNWAVVTTTDNYFFNTTDVGPGSTYSSNQNVPILADWEATKPILGIKLFIQTPNLVNGTWVLLSGFFSSDLIDRIQPGNFTELALLSAKGLTQTQQMTISGVLNLELVPGFELARNVKTVYHGGPTIDRETADYIMNGPYFKSIFAGNIPQSGMNMTRDESVLRAADLGSVLSSIYQKVKPALRVLSPLAIKGLGSAFTKYSGVPTDELTDYANSRIDSLFSADANSPMSIIELTGKQDVLRCASIEDYDELTLMGLILATSNIKDRWDLAMKMTPITELATFEGLVGTPPESSLMIREYDYGADKVHLEIDAFGLLETLLVEERRTRSLRLASSESPPEKWPLIAEYVTKAPGIEHGFAYGRGDSVLYCADQGFSIFEQEMGAEETSNNNNKKKSKDQPKNVATNLWKMGVGPAGSKGSGGKEEITWGKNACRNLCQHLRTRNVRSARAELEPGRKQPINLSSYITVDSSGKAVPVMFMLSSIPVTFRDGSVPNYLTSPISGVKYTENLTEVFQGPLQNTEHPLHQAMKNAVAVLGAYGTKQLYVTPSSAKTMEGSSLHMALYALFTFLPSSCVYTGSEDVSPAMVGPKFKYCLTEGRPLVVVGMSNNDVKQFATMMTRMNLGVLLLDAYVTVDTPPAAASATYVGASALSYLVSDDVFGNLTEKMEVIDEGLQNAPTKEQAQKIQAESAKKKEEAVDRAKQALKEMDVKGNIAKYKPHFAEFESKNGYSFLDKFQKYTKSKNYDKALNLYKAFENFALARTQKGGKAPKKSRTTLRDRARTSMIGLLTGTEETKSGSGSKKKSKKVVEESSEDEDFESGEEDVESEEESEEEEAPPPPKKKGKEKITSGSTKAKTRSFDW